MLSLRTADGLVLAPEAQEHLAARLAAPIAAGLLDVSQTDRLTLTLRGRMLSNEVFARLV
jgi:coproporphyrinogen III oxidase-like Fe-S oxidoreductase